MRSVEIEGGSIDEAIARALAALGVARDQVEIDILDNASRRLLGFGRCRARVRATMRAPLPGWGAGVDAPTEVDRPVGGAPDGPGDTVAFDGATFVRTTLGLMGFDAAVHERQAADGIRLDIDGADTGLAAAFSEDVRRALELIANRAAERQGIDSTRFTIACCAVRADGGGANGRSDARTRVDGDVRALARRLAARARARGETVTVPPLAPAEQALILAALRTEPSVTVRTTGSGTYRKLVIIPEEGRRGNGGAHGR